MKRRTMDTSPELTYRISLTVLLLRPRIAPFNVLAFSSFLENIVGMENLNDMMTDSDQAANLMMK